MEEEAAAAAAVEAEMEEEEETLPGRGEKLPGALCWDRPGCMVFVLSLETSKLPFCYILSSC